MQNKQLCDVATFLFESLNVNDTKNLALVHSEIFNGPPTSFISTSVYNRVPKRKRSDNSKFWDYVKTLNLKKPNLHILKESLKGLDLITLTLEWSFPIVRSTTFPEIDLQDVCPKLVSLTLKEYGQAKHSLLFFKTLKLPNTLKYFDVSHLHLPENEEDFYPVILSAKGKISRFCSCCSILTKQVWEKNWIESQHSL